MDYSKIRGFNYQPSYARTLSYIWTSFDPGVWEREVPWSLRFGSNMLRVWLDWHAYIEMGDTLLDHLDQALGVLDKHGLKMMPVLFNRWVDAKFAAGGISDNDLMMSGWGFDKFDSYVEALGQRFGADPRIGIWDICNEPSHTCAWDNRYREHAWLATEVAMLKRHTTIPITIGSMTYDYILQTAALSDVISFHPYTRQIGEMDKVCLDHLAIAKRFGKPLICTETCCGSFDDQERGRLAEENIETLERHKIGWIAWQLCEGKFVTANRDCTDDNAIRPGEGYMPFVLADGTTRPGHETLERR